MNTALILSFFGMNASGIALWCVVLFAMFGFAILIATLGSESSSRKWPVPDGLRDIGEIGVTCVCGFAGIHGSKEFMDHVHSCQYQTKKAS